MQEVFEKIIQRLRTEKNMDRSLVYSTEQCDAIRYAFGAAIDAVKVCVAEYNNGWIPCSDPPKDDRYVLLSFDNFSIPMVGRYEEDEKGGSYYIGDEMEPCVTQDIFVNAWQPLPPKYQPKGE